jgi:integrase
MTTFPEFSALEKAVRGLADSTREYYIIELRNFFQWLDEKGYFNATGKLEVPSKGIPLEKMPRLVQTGDAFKVAAKANTEWAEDRISTYLLHRKEIVETFPKDKQASKVSNLIGKPKKAIGKFCKFNKIPITWESVSDGLPDGNTFANDDKIERSQIQKLLEQKSADPLRAKAVFLILASTGMDVGAFEHLKWNHIKPVERDGKIACAFIHTYRMKKRMRPYDTLMTPEAYFAVKAYVDDRLEAGEKNVHDHPELTPLIRTVYRARSKWNEGPTEPKSLHKDGIEEIVSGALVSSGMRKPLPPGETRHPFQATKAFRKFFTSALDDEAQLPDKIIQVLRGDQVVFWRASYNRPTDRSQSMPYVSEKQLVDAYIKAVPYLTITTEARKDLNFEKTLEERLEEEKMGLSAKVDALAARLAQFERQDAMRQAFMAKERAIGQTFEPISPEDLADADYEAENSEIIAKEAERRAKRSPSEKNSEKLRLDLMMARAARRRNEGTKPD